MPRPAIIAVAILAVLAAGVGGFFLLRDSEPAATTAPSPTPDVDRHYLIHLENALATFGGANVEASGVLRVETGDRGRVEALSFSIDPLETPRGSTGPITVRLGQGDTQVTGTSTSVMATFPVEFLYPLLYELGGQAERDDVVAPERRQTGSATFEGSISGRAWDGKLAIRPDAVSGTDFNLPEGEIAVQAPAVYETPEQFANPTDALRVYCIEVQAERNSFSAGEVAAAINDMREIWRRNGSAFLTKEQIGRLNVALNGIEPGASEGREPAQIGTGKCYTVSFVRSAPDGGYTADAARRRVTVGRDGVARCRDSTLGRLTAHVLGHVALGLDADVTDGPPDALMRQCAPGTSVLDDLRERESSYVAYVAGEVTIPGLGARQNAVFGELERLLDELLAESPPPVATATPESTRSPTARPRPTSRIPTRTAR